MRRLEAAYHSTRHRIVDLLAEVDTGRDPKRVAVPACPEWSVHGVISHVTGLCADVLCGNIAGAAKPEWTTTQVATRRDLSTAQVLDEWDHNGPNLAALLDDFPGRYGHQVLADLGVHEHDLRGALGRPAARDSEAVHHALEFIVTTLLDAGATALGLGPVEIRTEDGRWVVGTGDPRRGDAQAAFATAVASLPPAERPSRPPVIASLDVSGFELFRAATGRRSRAQIRRYCWTADPDGYLELFDLWPFRLRDDDLVE
ncbi:MAG TPA: hypothetical protein VGF64_06205 [Acidimicrobiales bacterium]|jgi:uncharacterized protein (TIGR03083 family)